MSVAMTTLLIAILAGIGYLIAYHTYGRWLGGRIFRLSADATCPSIRLADGHDYVPTPRSVVFGHHFTSIAGTGPIVGPAIAVMWGWLPALLWIFFGSILMGAVHDFGTLVVSLRNNGLTVGDIAGRVMNRRVRLLFLLILFMALSIVLAIFGLVIAAVFRMYPESIFPCMVQIPLAVAIGLWLHRRGVSLLVPSLIALVLMYLSVIYGNVGWLGEFNRALAGWSNWTWVLVLLGYSFVASVLPVWVLLQPRDYINSLQLLTALGLVVVGIAVAGVMGGPPLATGDGRAPLEIVAPVFNPSPMGAPAFMPFLFITVACGAISGFHCLVSSGTSSKQLRSETDARFVGYGSMLTEGFLAVCVLLACVAGLGMGGQLTSAPWSSASASDSAGGSMVAAARYIMPGVGAVRAEASVEDDAVVVRRTLLDDGDDATAAPAPVRVPLAAVAAAGSGGTVLHDGDFWVRVERQATSSSVAAETATAEPGGGGGATEGGIVVTMGLQGPAVFQTRYESWTAADGLGAKVGAFVDGAGNFLRALGIPAGVAIALMGVLVASFAGTTMDTACRLQRYVIQELAQAMMRGPGATAGPISPAAAPGTSADAMSHEPTGSMLNPLRWLATPVGATTLAVVTAAFMAAMPQAGQSWGWATAGTGGMILWPMFGATNQLLAGLAFLVVIFHLWRRRTPIWFMVLPAIFMLVMPAWALSWQLFIGDAASPSWIESERWVLVFIAGATLLLEAWMIVEAVLMFPRVQGLLEQHALDQPQPLQPQREGAVGFDGPALLTR